VKGALLAAEKRAGLPKITWHMFRHTFASRLTGDGVDIVTVKDLLGHSNISTTLRAKRRAVGKLRKRDKIVAMVPRQGKESSIMW
jgi:integrase/recombinase XerD